MNATQENLQKAQDSFDFARECLLEILKQDNQLVSFAVLDILELLATVSNKTANLGNAYDATIKSQSENNLNVEINALARRAQKSSIMDGQTE